MNSNHQIFSSDNIGVRLAMVLLLVVLIAFSNLSYFSAMSMDMDKIEKLAEGESDIDIEEKEKNQEVEEDSFLNSYRDQFGLFKNLLHDQQYAGQITVYHLKIPTPPPDLI